MTKYQHNQVYVDIVVGETYCYYEDGQACNVKLLEDNSDAEGVKFKLEILDAPRKSDFKVGAIFDVFASSGDYCYSGMWRLYPVGEYIWDIKQ